MAENPTDAPPPRSTQWSAGRLLVRGILIALIIIVVPRLMRSNLPADMDYMTAELDRDQGKLDKAIAAYTAIIARSPDEARGYAGRGESYRLKHDYARALADFDAALKRAPRDYEAFLYRCRANHDTGAIDRAIAACREAAAIRANEAEPPSRLGRMLLARGEIADAKAQFEAAITLQKEPFGGDDNRIFRGLIALFHENRPAAAADDFSAALKRAIDHVDGVRLFGGDEQAALATVSYLVIWRHLARVRAGQDDAAEVAASLAQLTDPVRRDWWLQHPINEDPTEARILALALKRWPARLIALYAGKLTPDDIRAAAAAAEGDAAARAQRACDADLYLGIDAAQNGAREEAARLLQAAIDGCPSGAPEAAFARLELQRLPAAQ